MGKKNVFTMQYSDNSSEKMSAKSWAALLCLTFATFVFNTSEFMPVSLLTDIAADFSVSEAKAGMLISVYAWFVAILSLPLMIMVSRMEMKRLMLCVLALFAVGQFLSASASNYYVLMAARVIVASAHSVFWAINVPMAARAVPDKYRSLAISMVSAGTSIAMIAGLPIGRAIGLLVGWRTTFAIVGGITLAVGILMAILFPKMPTRGTFSLSKLPALLKIKQLRSMYIITALLTLAYYTVYSYVEPFLLQVTGMPQNGITITLTIYGLAGIVASVLFSKFYDRRPSGFISAGIGGVVLALAVMYPASVGYASSAIVCACMGLFITMFAISFQAEIIKAAPQESTSVAMSIHSGIYNFGIGTGTLLGGAVCSYWSIAYIGYAGAAVACAAFIYCMFTLRRILKLNE